MKIYALVAVGLILSVVDMAIAAISLLNGMYMVAAFTCAAGLVVCFAAGSFEGGISTCKQFERAFNRTIKNGVPRR